MTSSQLLPSIVVQEFISGTMAGQEPRRLSVALNFMWAAWKQHQRRRKLWNMIVSQGIATGGQDGLPKRRRFVASSSREVAPVIPTSATWVFPIGR